MAGLFCGDDKVQQNSQATPLVMCSNSTDILSGTEIIITYNVILGNVNQIQQTTAHDVNKAENKKKS